MIIAPAKGNLSCIPKNRSYVIYFTGLKSGFIPAVIIDGNAVDFKAQYNAAASTLVVTIGKTTVTSEIHITLDRSELADNHPIDRIFDFINLAQIAFETKDSIYNAVLKLQQGRSLAFILGELQSMKLESELLVVICEILLA